MKVRMPDKFQIIVADPPWSFTDFLKMSDVKRGAKANYNTMTISQIKQLPIKELADANGAVLALWVPSSLLQDGLDVMKAWGFTHKQTYVWVKTKKDIWKDVISKFVSNLKDDTKNYGYVKNTWKKAFQFKLKNNKLSDLLSFGMGRLFRQTHEICLIGTNSNKIYKKLNNKSQRSVSFGMNLKHSAKPDHLQDSLEIMFPDCNKLEIFARRNKIGWMCIGNESPITFGEDVNVSLQKLL